VVEVLAKPVGLSRGKAHQRTAVGARDYIMSSPEYRRYTSSTAPASLSDVWDSRELLRSLIVRNLKVKYQRSVLGFVWTLVNPIMTAGVLIAVFSVVIRIPIEAYWAFLISGYFAWNFVAQNLGSSTTVLADHAALRRSISFPTELLLFSNVISRLFEFGVELAIVVLVLVFFHHHGVPPSILLLPVLVLLLVVLVVGLSMLIAVVSTFYHDVQHVLPIVLLTMFYLTPVFYPIDIVPAGLQPFFYLNPFATIVTLFHTILYDGLFPSAGLLGGAALWALFFFVTGHRVFNRYKAVLAEIA
jgi:ABC-2 type transport system permease protein